jgi:RNA polymerase sigma factor (sigma-70 family)
MMRAVRGIDSYQPGPAGFDGWVFGIARRVCADYHRHRARLRRQDGVAAAMAEVVEDGRAPGDPAAAADEHAELRRAFELLLPGNQQVLELRVIAGLSVEQAAWVLEKAPGAVRTAQSRALGRLRQLIKTHDERFYSPSWGPIAMSPSRAGPQTLRGPLRVHPPRAQTPGSCSALPHPPTSPPLSVGWRLTDPGHTGQQPDRWSPATQ